MGKTYRIGAELKSYLISHGIKQTYLAKQTGLSDSTISDICKGDRADQHIPCLIMYKICKALDVPMSTFVNDDLLEV